MYDILPFPNITATDAKEQVAQINNYLIQLKETLEFTLTNISADNLSPELAKELRNLGAEVKTTQEEQADATQQIAQRIITVPDVVYSQMFKDATVGGVKVNGSELPKDSNGDVNVEVPTDYIVGGSQTTTSHESSGLNIFTFTNANGDTDTFEVRNGEKGEKGDRGEKGDTGLQGERGPQGIQGEQGSVGPQGPKGDTGPSGVSIPTSAFFVLEVDSGTGNLYCVTNSNEAQPFSMDANGNLYYEVEE